ncbi:MAG: exosortase E/protease, VPEID-CTERM system [Rhodocyclaceae bacterium]|nr:exosortase E/protease, VPEID-CTERM system [Rhodocyclaceae bacterium]
MLLTEPLNSGQSRTGWRLPARWGFLALLLGAELLGLSLRFDTASLSGDDSWWTRFAGNLPQVLRIGLAFIGALFLLLAPRGSGIVDAARQSAESHGWLRRLALHLLVFGAFSWATLALFGSAEHGHRLPGLAVGGWFSLGMLSCLLWLSAAAPARFWFRLASDERWPLAVAALAGFLAWVFGLAAELFWKPLAEGTFWLSYQLLRPLYPDALYDLSGYSLGTPGFMVNIAPQCSGYEGIGLVLVFLALYLWLFRAEIRFPQAFLLFPVGALAIWLANALRITLLIALGSSFSKEVALGGFHSQAGWIAFIAIALGLIFAMRRLHLFTKEDAVAPPAPPSSVPALLVPLLVLMAAIMLTSALSAGFDRYYPLRVVAAAGALWHFRSVYLHWQWRPSWQALAIGGAVFALWMLLEPGADSANSVLGTALASLPPGQKALWLAFRVLGSVLAVPLIEELAFRGYLLRHLAGRADDDLSPGRFAWLPFLVSSIAFGLLHRRWFAGTLAGMAYALAYYRRGRIADAVAAHVATNGLIALYVLAFGAWSLWS